MKCSLLTIVTINIINNQNNVAPSHNLGTLVPLPTETDPFVKTQVFRDLPSSPVFRNLGFHRRGHGSDPWTGN